MANNIDNYLEKRFDEIKREIDEYSKKKTQQIDEYSKKKTQQIELLNLMNIVKKNSGRKMLLQQQMKKMLMLILKKMMDTQKIKEKINK